MLPLHGKAAMRGWNKPALLKVAGLQDFASTSLPLSRMLLDLRSLHAEQAEPLKSLSWAGFLTDSVEQIPPGRPGLAILGDREIARPGDVVEVSPSTSKIATRYRRGDNGNVLFATERCNSYCLMCSQPPRQIDDEWRVDQICLLIELIDADEPSLAISGGEPTLLGQGLLRIVEKCAATLPRTHIHILSNGRKLAESDYTRHFAGLHPSLTWGIPLYGDTYRLHDYVVQSTSAFAETIRGLYALHGARQRIEIRTVLVKPTVERLDSLARFIYRNLPFVEHVALMGIEPIGFAKANREALWIDPADTMPQLEKAVEFLSCRGIPVSLYNLPLCVLPRRLWPFSQRSISNWKQEYLPVCEGCAARDICGGFFSWVTPDWTSRAISPLEPKELQCATH